jgi:hypothetical protein
MTTKTAYKVLEVNGVHYLQYLKPYRFLLFFKMYNWVNIPYPNVKGKAHVVCDLIHEFVQLKKFILKYPDIDEYFKTEFVERSKKFGTPKRW